MRKINTILVIDRSGSMGGREKFVMDGFNEHIQQVKDVASKDPDGQYTVSIVTFNHEVYRHLWKVPVTEAQELKPGDYTTSGGTAFLDALGYVVDQIAEEPYDDETSYLVIMITDGEECSSRHYLYGEALEGLKGRVLGFSKERNLTVTYVGCSADVLTKLGQQTGAKVANMMAMDFSTAKSTVRGMSYMNRRTNNYYQACTRGVMSADCLMSDSDNEIGTVDDDVDLDTSVVSPTHVPTPPTTVKPLVVSEPTPVKLDWVAPPIKTDVQYKVVPPNFTYGYSDATPHASGGMWSNQQKVNFSHKS